VVGVTSDTIYLELRVGDDAVTLRLEPDREAATSAWVRAGGWALSHLDHDPSPAIRARLSALGRAFAACGSVARAVEETFRGATLRTKRRVDVDQRAPRWPLRLRSGAPDAARLPHGSIWPFDAETTAMRLGLRRLVLREWLHEGDADADARWLEDDGLVVERVRDRPESGPVALFAAHDRAILVEAREAHRAACTPDARWADGVRWMGDALGYPPCCVDAFVRARSRDDVAMFADLLPPIDDPPSSPLVGWLVGATQVVSHAPCSSSCAPSRAIASRTLAEIDRRHEGFAAAWERIAKRVHAIDATGRCFAFDAEGSLAEGARVTHAMELVPPRDDDRSMEHVIVEDATWHGCTLSIEDVRLIARRAHDDRGVRLRAGLACDQRA
jgi:hypothetical protein